MQPCSQPRYGLIDCSNAMSGESLRAMIVRAGSTWTSVRGGAGASSVEQLGVERVAIGLALAPREPPLPVR